MCVCEDPIKNSNYIWEKMRGKLDLSEILLPPLLVNKLINAIK